MMALVLPSCREETQFIPRQGRYGRFQWDGDDEHVVERHPSRYIEADSVSFS